jgi:hypothetical protein
VSATVGRSHEKSAVVDLADANVFGAQGTAGVEVRLWRAKMAAEYGFARVSSFSLKIGMDIGSF